MAVSEQRALHDHAARRVAPLVEQGEQRVEDRRVGLEDLVEEDDLRRREHALGAALVASLAERCDVDGAEELVRLGEAREQVLEVVRVQEAREHSNQRALGGSRRTHEHRVLTSHHRDEEEANDLVLAEETRLERARHLRESHRKCGGSRRVLTLNHVRVPTLPAFTRTGREHLGRPRRPRRASAPAPGSPWRGRA